MEQVVRNACQQNAGIKYLGQLPYADVMREIRHARALLFPSIWYETFGRSMIEAFATGTPVIASNIGSMAEIVQDESNGLLFRAGDSADLGEKVLRILKDDEFFLRACRAARTTFLNDYTAEKNVERLLEIYAQASSLGSSNREQTYVDR